MTEMYFSPDPASPSNPVRMELDFRGRTFRFWTDHGVFSRGELDRGTELLLKAIPGPLEGTALDLGCGWGPLGIILCGLNEGLRAVLSDVNARAAALAARNIRENGLEDRCEAVCSDGFADVSGMFDHIVCNPPIRAGKDVTLQQLVDISPFSLQDYQEDYSVACEARKPATKPPEKKDIRKAAAITLMGLGLSQVDADKFVCQAVAILKDCTQETIIAREAYQLFQKQEVQEPVPAPLEGISGYQDLLSAGLIDNAQTKDGFHESV